jgi:hypothetical protein
MCIHDDVTLYSIRFDSICFDSCWRTVWRTPTRLPHPRPTHDRRLCPLRGRSRIYWRRGHRATGLASEEGIGLARNQCFRCLELQVKSPNCPEFSGSPRPGNRGEGSQISISCPGHPLGERFLNRVRQTVRQHAFPIPAQRTTIDFALLEGEAGYIGAAGIARLAWHKKKG